MKNWKKMMSAALTAAMTVTMLAGCGGGETEKGSRGAGIL